MEICGLWSYIDKSSYGQIWIALVVANWQSLFLGFFLDF